MKFKKEITTADFWYDLFEGGYIKPEKVLESKDDAKRVQEAIKVLKEFQKAGEEQDMIEYC
jgi:hypothetical protein